MRVIEADCKSLSFNALGTHLLFNSGSTAYCLDLQSKMPIPYSFGGQFEGHTDQISALKFSNNESFVISVSQDRTIKLWNRYTYSCVKTYIPSKDNIKNIFFDKSYSYFGYAYENKIVLWQRREQT
jgi:WD40 repeat protein